jgi:hypothetical protein
MSVVSPVLAAEVIMGNLLRHQGLSAWQRQPSEASPKASALREKELSNFCIFFPSVSENHTISSK